MACVRNNNTPRKPEEWTKKTDTVDAFVGRLTDGTHRRMDDVDNIFHVFNTRYATRSRIIVYRQDVHTLHTTDKYGKNGAA